jgi:hypothetical protein
MLVFCKTDVFGAVLWQRLELYEREREVGSRREYKIKVDLEGYRGMSGLDPFDLG